jgi:chemotaxis response regulator CheB
MSQKIKALIVDDSAVMRQVLTCTLPSYRDEAQHSR